MPCLIVVYVCTGDDGTWELSRTPGPELRPLIVPASLMDSYEHVMKMKALVNETIGSVMHAGVQVEYFKRLNAGNN